MADHKKEVDTEALIKKPEVLVLSLALLIAENAEHVINSRLFIISTFCLVTNLSWSIKYRQLHVLFYSVHN